MQQPGLVRIKIRKRVREKELRSTARAGMDQKERERRKRKRERERERERESKGKRVTEEKRNRMRGRGRERERKNQGKTEKCDQQPGLVQIQVTRLAGGCEYCYNADIATPVAPSDYCLSTCASFTLPPSRSRHPSGTWTASARLGSPCTATTPCPASRYGNFNVPSAPFSRVPPSPIPLPTRAVRSQTITLRTRSVVSVLFG